MISFETSIRVRYAETDRLGFVYYGNYAQFFEVGRVEALRAMGFSYKALEESGIGLPVLSYNIKYFKPAFYDDLLRIRTIMHEVPEVRLNVEHETYNDAGELLNKADIVLVFYDIAAKKPCSAPAEWREKIKSLIAPNC